MAEFKMTVYHPVTSEQRVMYYNNDNNNKLQK